MQKIEVNHKKDFYVAYTKAFFALTTKRFENKPFIEKMLKELLDYTEKRIVKEKTVNPSFIEDFLFEQMLQVPIEQDSRATQFFLEIVTMCYFQLTEILRLYAVSLEIKLHTTTQASIHMSL